MARRRLNKPSLLPLALVTVDQKLRIFTKFSGVWVTVTQKSPKHAYFKICPSLETLVSKVWASVHLEGQRGMGTRNQEGNQGSGPGERCFPESKSPQKAGSFTAWCLQIHECV